MARRWAVAAAVALVASALTGCNGESKRTTAPAPAPTPITKLDVSSIRVARVAFCDRLSGEGIVDRAPDGEPQREESWGNGDPAPSDGSTGGGTGDVTHELGCAWTGSNGTAARAWIFARPVTTDFAETLVSQAGQQPGCTAEAATTFGSPALLQTCTLPGGLQRIRRAGLFADSWLTCEVTGAAAPDLAARTDTWCAAVVAALRAP